MKLLRYLAIGVGALVLLVVLAVAAALVIVDGAFVKSRLEREMQARQRTLTIEGEPKLQLFPVAGITLGKVVLTEPRSDRAFLTLESADIAVRVLPLVSGEAVVERFKVAGLHASLVRGKDGRLNVDDLVSPGAREARTAAIEERAVEGKPPRLRIAEIAIERAHLAFRDEATGQEVSVADLNLKTGRLDGDAPGPVAFSAHLTGRKPELDIRAQASGAVRFSLARQEIGIDGFTFQVKGRADRDSLAAEIAAPKVEITPARAAGSAVTATLKLSGPKHGLDARLRIAAVEGNARALSVPSLALDFDASGDGRAVKGALTTPLQADLVDRAFDLPKIVASVTVQGPGLPQKSVTLPIAAAVKANLGKQTAAAELTTRFEDSNFQASFAATRLEPLVATFDVKADRLNVDRFVPAPTKEAAKGGDDRIDLSGLKGPQLTGKVAIGSLTARRLKLSDLKAEVKLAGGKLVAPHTASLYGGTLAGSVGAEAEGNRVALKQALGGVQLEPLLRDLAEQDRLEGRGNIALDVHAEGATVAAMKKALAGTARVELRDGAVKGINLAEAIQDVRSVIGTRSAKAGDPSKRTDFSEITASFTIRNGVAHNEDLQGKAPLLRVTGAGDVDIGGSTVNYTARAAVVATSKGQGGRDLSNLAGVTVPVRITGALEKPDIAVDFTELATKSGVDIAKVLAGKSGAAGPLEKLGDKIRGLFKR